jgi:hypothetical protein
MDPSKSVRTHGGVFRYDSTEKPQICVFIGTVARAHPLEVMGWYHTHGADEDFIRQC